MATGTIKEFDASRRRGYINPDVDAPHEHERIPFELEHGDNATFSPGDHVRYDVEGGLAGIMAIRVRKE